MKLYGNYMKLYEISIKMIWKTMKLYENSIKIIWNYMKKTMKLDENI